MRAGKDGNPVFLSNHAGGILGGISTGQAVVCRFAVKPTSSILSPRRTIDIDGKDTDIMTKGRHDPCVGIRAVPVGEAMMALVLADHMLRGGMGGASIGFGEIRSEAGQRVGFGVAGDVDGQEAAVAGRDRVVRSRVVHQLVGRRLVAEDLLLEPEQHAADRLAQRLLLLGTLRLRHVSAIVATELGTARTVGP